MTFALPGFDLDTFVRNTLAEDLGVGLPGGGKDVTSQSVIPADARFAGVMDSRDAIVVAGLPLAEAFFRHLDPECTIETLVEDGDAVEAGADLMRMEGNARALLTGGGANLKLGQHVVLAKDTPLCNVWLTMLQGLGINTERHGDSTDVVKELL